MIMMLETVKRKLEGAAGHQTIATIAVSLGSFATAVSSSWISPALPKILRGESPIEGALTHTDISWISSLLFLGMIFSPVLSGRLMERFGAKRTLLYLSVTMFASWLCVWFGRTILVMCCARFLAGFWGGIGNTVIPVYLGEISDPKIRGTLVAIYTLIVNVGMLVPYVIGPYISYGALTLICSTTILIFVVVYYMMPDSPYYYVVRGEHEKASTALSWFRGQGSDIAAELKSIEQSVEKQTKSVIGFCDIVGTKGNRRALLIVEAMFIFTRVCGIALIRAFGSIVLPDIGLLESSDCMICLALTWVASGLVTMYFIDRVKRKPLLIVSCLGCAFAMTMAGCWYWLDSESDISMENYNYVPFLCFLFFGIFFSMGLDPIVVALKGELFPASLRGHASSMSTITSAVFGFVATKIFYPIADSVGMYANYCFCAANCLLATLFVLMFFVETMGKSLEEIQNKLNQVDVKEII